MNLRYLRFTSLRSQLILSLVIVVLTTFGFGFYTFIKLQQISNLVPTGVVAQEIITLSRVSFIFLMVVIVVILSLFVHILLNLTSSLQIILRGIQAIKNGDLGYRIKLFSDNEFGIIANFLNEAVIEIGRSRSALVLEKQQELEKLKLDFVSMAAHELRTPLTAIRGFASLMQVEGKKTLNPAMCDYLQKLILSSDQLANLIDNFLNVAKIESKALSVNLIPCDIFSTIEDVCHDFEPYAKFKKQQLRLQDLRKDKLLVMADQVRVREVLNNLVGNAINYTQSGGVITVVLRQNEKHLLVSVEDNGPGIRKAVQAKLFTKFYRVGGPLQAGSKGTGLGLYICKEIIVAHHGTIFAASEEGKGTTFTFSLPLASALQIKQYQSQTFSRPTSTPHHGLMMNPNLG